MRILVAPDKFKGSLTANEVCLAVENGVHLIDSSIEVIKHPLADGGEGTLEILQNYFKLETISVLVKNPLFKDITASYKISKNTAYIEMSNASGLQLLEKNEQNCFYTTTFGTGELILDAIKRGFKNIILFIGGSATNDAGIGMAAALGYEFCNSKGEKISPIGKELLNIAEIKRNHLKIDVNTINFTVVCDVKNPLFGINGAAYTYGSQKGASTQEIELLDQGLQNFSNKVEKYLHTSVSTIKGAGAAGGLGAGAVCFLNATIKSGIDFVIEQTRLKEHLKKGIDLIITGEGSVDKQTIHGKVIKGISDIAQENNIPFYIISGIAKDRELVEENLKPSAISTIVDLNVPVEEAVKNADFYVSLITSNIIKSIKKANK
ncbi:glycerate kinase [Lutibacter sp. B1]|uniref:glycerate kinase n=1 Tax=Lutibacter sp. B1 TaxID=2725996 RepID=UPI001457073E|nr:glycerate kinase [Lutibacter sp. B1]NLP58103.1 glycerate kinase [Lutibacter sp. B1]